jgi:glycosyltransferase involved in cell wall biosynthesis
VDGRTGLLADRPAAWRDALMTLARDPALRGAMGATGRALVVRDYSIAAAAPRLAEVIRRVAR